MLPTCNVRCAVHENDGTPVAGALITARLDRFEIHDGYVVPELVEATTDAAGLATLALWPNALGATASTYQIRIIAPNGMALRTTATVPAVPDIDLHLIAELPAYEGKPEGQLIIDAAIAAAAPAIDAQLASEIAAAASLAHSQNAALIQIEVQGLRDETDALRSAAADSAAQADNYRVAAGLALAEVATMTATATAAATAAEQSEIAAAGHESASATLATTAASAATAATEALDDALALYGSIAAVQAAETLAADSAAAAAADRTQTGIDRIATGEDRTVTTAARAQTSLDAATTIAKALEATNAATAATEQAGISTTRAGEAAQAVFDAQATVTATQSALAQLATNLITTQTVVASHHAFI